MKSNDDAAIPPGSPTQPDADVVNPGPYTVTVWSDIGCPWASLALHTLHATIVERGAALLVDHRAFPLELFNRKPTPRSWWTPR